MTFFYVLINWLLVSHGCIYLSPARGLVRQAEASLTDAQWNYAFNLDSTM